MCEDNDGECLLTCLKLKVYVHTDSIYRKYDCTHEEASVLEVNAPMCACVDQMFYINSRITERQLPISMV
jgi:hypothetical protein